MKGIILYNVTVNIDNSIEKDWLNWMQQTHIPEVMATGYFLENKLYKVLVENEDGTTYSVQYSCASMQDLMDYQAKEAPRLQKAHREKYEGQFVAFRTVLQQA